MIALSSGIDFQAKLLSLGLPAEHFGAVLAAFWEWAFAADQRAGSGQRAAGSEEMRREKDRERKRIKRAGASAVSADSAEYPRTSAECPRTTLDGQRSTDHACRDARAQARTPGVCVSSSSENKNTHTHPDPEDPALYVKRFHELFDPKTGHLRQPAPSEIGHAATLFRQFSPEACWGSLEKGVEEIKRKFPACNLFGGGIGYLTDRIAKWKPPREAGKRIKSRCKACGSEGPHAVDSGTVTCSGCGRVANLRQAECAVGSR